jgi:alpha-methylacyl-CoA racemase
LGPLAGLRVIEVTNLAPVPFGCMVLADLGADVVRIDRPKRPGPGLQPPPGPLDRGKYALSLDIKTAAGKERLLAIAEHADVFVEGFRPGVAEQFGLGPAHVQARNPGIIYGRMTGWGQHGPLAHTAGHDINYIAVAGALDLVGRPDQPPVPPGNLLGDFAGGGMLLALGILAALHERHLSGRGQVVDAAMVDGAALYTAFMHGMHAAGLWNEPRGHNMVDGAAPFYDSYECSDGGYVAVGCFEPQFFRELLEKLGIDQAGLPGQMDRSGWPRLRQAIGERFKQRTRDDWARFFADSDACVTPVLSPWEAHRHPHHQSRGSFVEVAGLVQPAPAPRFDRTPPPTPRPPVDSPARVEELLSRWGVPNVSAAAWE